KAGESGVASASYGGPGAAWEKDGAPAAAAQQTPLPPSEVELDALAS
ncbi:hypothetical protein V492_07504, partial [Pseudogymnoascus sp. VKM F-4246]